MDFGEKFWVIKNIDATFSVNEKTLFPVETWTVFVESETSLYLIICKGQ